MTSSSTCGICGGQRVTEKVCLQVLLFLPLTVNIYISFISHYILEATDSNANLRVVGEPWKVNIGTHKFVLRFKGHKSQTINGCWVCCCVSMVRTNQTVRKCTGGRAPWIQLATKLLESLLLQLECEGTTNLSIWRISFRRQSSVPNKYQVENCPFSDLVQFL